MGAASWFFQDALASGFSSPPPPTPAGATGWSSGAAGKRPQGRCSAQDAPPLARFINASLVGAVGGPKRASGAALLAGRVSLFGGVLTLVFSIWKAEIRFSKLKRLQVLISNGIAWARL